MYEIALKMLFGDRAKYLMLVSAISFASLLMTQQIGIFAGLMLWTTATIRNTDVPIWVMDPNVQQVNEPKPMRDTDVQRVRSVKGVAWAVPFYFALQQARLYDGKFKSVQLIGLDSTTLIGAPSHLLEGNLSDLWQAHSVIIDEVGVEKLSEGREKPIGIGDIFEINDHEVRIVGISKVARSFFGNPYVFTTYERALEIVPKTRKNLSFVLVKPQKGVSKEKLAQDITKATGLKALTDNVFFWETIMWFVKNTGIPVSFGMTILLGFIVGLAVSGQTFYTFILENLGNIGALKAMGATNALLFRMLMVQSLFVGFTGFGIGALLASIFGFMALKTEQPPFFLPYQVLIFTFSVVLFICLFSAFLGIRKVKKLEPAEVFRA